MKFIILLNQVLKIFYHKNKIYFLIFRSKEQKNKIIESFYGKINKLIRNKVSISFFLL